MKIDEKCYCKDRHSIVIDRRSASRVTSCVALGAFIVFATGYFIGKRHTIQNELESHELALFANRIQYAIDEQSRMAQAEEQEYSGQETKEEMVLAARLHQPEDAPIDAAPDNAPVITAHMQQHEPEQNSVHYVALLAGYGTQRAAQQFAQRLENKGIKAEVRTRVSKSSQKKQRKWYQVVTQKYENKQALSSLVEQLKIQERLGNDVRIVEIA